MGGFFGVAAKDNCTSDLFFGTDYHSHLGTQRGGMAVYARGSIHRAIHDIRNAQFRSKFEEELQRLRGNVGIGCISDFDDQPILVSSHLGLFGVVTVGVIQNQDQLVARAFKERSAHFSEVANGAVNPTELVASLISHEDSFEAGIQKVQELVDGSCSVLVLTEQGIYAARDRLGRTPVTVGKGDGDWAVTMETCALPNLDYEVEKYLGPGEVVLLTPDGMEQKVAPCEEMQICSFLWVYYGYPASSYEGINTEETRYRCGAALAGRDDLQVDIVAGIPDSGTGHAIGYANASGMAYGRPFVKYTPTWPRSFMPQDQSIRDLVARMKLIPVRSLVAGKKILFCEDSIVRGTQLKDIVQRLYDYGAAEVHMRPACPPLVFGCRYLNFSCSRTVLDLATRQAIKELEGSDEAHLDEYSDPDSERYNTMVDRIGQRLRLTSLKYQRLPDLVEAIGLPKAKLCTYCWDRCTGCTSPREGGACGL